MYSPTEAGGEDLRPGRLAQRLVPVGRGGGGHDAFDERQRAPHSRAVAVQLAFEKKQTLKPVFHFISSRVETRRFQAVGDSRVEENQALSSYARLKG